MDLLLDRVRRADIAGMFAEPVPAEMEGYHAYIKTPMDLSTMEARLASYHTITAFEKDLALILENCIKFNGGRSALGQYAKEIAREWLKATQAARMAEINAGLAELIRLW